MRPMGMQIMILMIDRFGKLFTVTRWQQVGDPQIHLQCSFVQMRVQFARLIFTN
jgi:hypothetical protein